jgi:hypothetical protein
MITGRSHVSRFAYECQNREQGHCACFFSNQAEKGVSRTMLQTVHRFFLLKGCVALIGLTTLLGLSACATVQATTGTSQPTTSPAPTPTPSNGNRSLAASLPLLLKSVQALSQAQSVHVDANGHGSLQERSGQRLGGGVNTTYQVSAQSDVLIPKQEEQGQVTVTFAPTNTGASPTTLQASEVFASQHLYVRVGTASTWQVVDLTAQLQSAAKGLQQDLPPSQQLLQLAAPHVSIVDHGTRNTGQQRLHHLTVTFDRQSARALALLFPQPMLKQALAAITFQQPLTIDLFIDEATALPVRLVIESQGQVNIAAALGTNGTNQQGKIGSQASTVQASFSLTITLSKYNQPVQIHVPTISQRAQPGATLS